MQIECPRCLLCGEKTPLNVDHYSPVQIGGAVALYQKGAFIQDAFPFMTAGEREQILTGTHPDCWDKMFGDET